jgi:MFS family permease
MPSLPTPTVASIPNGRLAVLFMVMLVAAAGNTAMQSILPALGAKLGIGDVWVSLAFSWSALLWVITAPKWARQSDKRGRKALMALGIWGFVSSMLFCGLTLWAGLEGWMSAGVTFAFFALFRSLYGGFGSAAPPAVQAYVASRTEAAERTKALSLVASSFGLGTVIGPTIAPYLILPVLGLSGPLFVFAGVGVAVIIALRLVLPDDTPRFEVRGQVSAYPAAGGGPQVVDSDGDGEIDQDQGDSTARIGWFDARVRGWNIAGLVGGHAQAMTMGVIGFLILDRLHLRSTPDLAAEPVGGAGALLVGLGDTLPTISTGFAFAMLGFGLFRPGFTAGASLAVPRPLQGQVAGQTASINGAAYIVAPAIGVLLYNWHAELTFLLITTLCLGLSIWAWRGLADVGEQNPEC